MKQIKMNASLSRITKDGEGQVKLTLNIPKMHAWSAMGIPEEAELLITIEVLGSMQGFGSVDKSEKE